MYKCISICKRRSFLNIIVVARLSFLCERMIESLSVVILLCVISIHNKPMVNSELIKKIGSKTFLHLSVQVTIMKCSDKQLFLLIR